VPLPTPLPLVSTFTDDDAGVELAATLSVAAFFRLGSYQEQQQKKAKSVPLPSTA